MAALAWIKRFFRWLFLEPIPPVETPPPLERRLEYIPLRIAGERAASQFFNTILWDFAKLHGLDEQDRITNWFANLICSQAAFAIKQDDRWTEVHDVEGCSFSIIDGGTIYKRIGFPPAEVAIREDWLADFFEKLHERISDNPKFYRVRRDPMERVDDPPISNKPNRENTFDWDYFDFGTLERSVAGIDQRLSLIEAKRSKHMAVKTKAATKKTSKPAKKKAAPKRKKAAPKKKPSSVKGTNGRGTH